VCARKSVKLACESVGPAGAFCLDEFPTIPPPTTNQTQALFAPSYVLHSIQYSAHVVIIILETRNRTTKKIQKKKTPYYNIRIGVRISYVHVRCSPGETRSYVQNSPSKLSYISRLESRRIIAVSIAGVCNTIMRTLMCARVRIKIQKLLFYYSTRRRLRDVSK
jgi:hypothetical protein